jgi:hypothetical protein
LVRELKDEKGSDDGKKNKKKPKIEKTVQLNDPFGLVTHKKIAIKDAENAVNFLMIYEEYLIAIAS